MRRMFSEKQIKGLAVAGINEATEAGQVVKIDIDNLVDKDGHNRFIEFDTITTSWPEGVEKVYAKASLSGTHLMFVAAFNIANGTTIGYIDLAKFTLPDWIYNKIYPSVQNAIEYKATNAYASDYSSQSFGTKLSKGNENSITISKEGAFTATADRYVRISYDLLIDNE